MGFNSAFKGLKRFGPKQAPCFKTFPTLKPSVIIDPILKC